MSKTKSVFVTGGNRGIGFDLIKLINKRFSPEFLIVTYRNKDQAKELHEYAATHGNVHLLQMEVTDESKYAEIVAKVDKLTGGAGVNLLINNAGILTTKGQTLADVTKEGLLQHYEVNTIAPILITQAFLPLLEKAVAGAKDSSIGIARSAVVNITTYLASITLNDGKDGNGSLYYAYRASKAALNMATKSLSNDLIPKKILTVGIHPGWVQTDLGGPKAPMTVDDSVQNIVNTLEGLNESHNGGFLNFDGKTLPF